ncbi:hypothetical protein [Hydrogenimonas urashimensis]|uniref:hypothetical protein n=1 Tax=Hydrogenimonas urashimensis TaxID=2740515 RepID=UPI0019153A69|nr:hypothetical protein [Hydrogenimonas urashimensis]
MKKPIFVVASSFDGTVDYMIEKYEDDFSFVRFDIDRMDKYGISIDTTSGTQKVKFVSENFCSNDLFNDISSIYFRKIFFPELNEYDKRYRSYMLKEIYGFVSGLVDSFVGKVLTKPYILRRTENKIYQLFLAKELGFDVPNSSITNDPEYATSTIERGDWIVKPVTTGKLNENAIVQTNKIVTDTIENIELSPIYLQEYVEKEYELRVTVIDDKFYTVKIIASDKTDWRKNEHNNIYELIPTPYDVEKECKKFLKKIGMRFGCFDYIFSKGKYRFLECNPNGQWLWLEKKLSLDISKHILEYLNA